jgi:hypothetical protein
VSVGASGELVEEGGGLERLLTEEEQAELEQAELMAELDRELEEIEAKHLKRLKKDKPAHPSQAKGPTKHAAKRAAEELAAARRSELEAKKQSLLTDEEAAEAEDEDEAAAAGLDTGRNERGLSAQSSPPADGPRHGVAIGQLGQASSSAPASRPKRGSLKAGAAMATPPKTPHKGVGWVDKVTTAAQSGAGAAGAAPMDTLLQHEDGLSGPRGLVDALLHDAAAAQPVMFNQVWSAVPCCADGPVPCSAVGCTPGTNERERSMTTSARAFTQVWNHLVKPKSLQNQARALLMERRADGTGEGWAY